MLNSWNMGHALLRFVDRWYWVLLLLAAPVLLFPSPQRAWVMLVVPLGWLVAWLATGRPLPVTPLNGSLLLLYVMVLVSLYATYNVAVSLPKISGMVLGIAAFFIIARTGQRTTGWWISLVIFLGIGFAIGVTALLGTRWAAKIHALAPIIAELEPRIKGLPGAQHGLNGNEVAGGLLWAVPILLSLSVLLVGKLPGLFRTIGCIRTLAALLVWPVTLFLAGILILTQSRSAYIGLGITVLVMVFFSLPRTGRLIYLIVLLLVLSPVVLITLEVGPGVVWDRLAGNEMGSLDPLAKLQVRGVIWERALQGIEDFPLTGMGMNAFRGVVHVLYSLPFPRPTDIAHAHNEFLQAALDLGVPGLIAFLALYIGAFVMLWELWQTAKDQENNVPAGSLSPASHPPLIRALVLGLGGGLLAHLIYGMTDAVALGAKPGVLFWMLLGLICGLHAQIRSDPDDAVPPDRRLTIY